MIEKKRFEWGSVTHPGIWACGGGRQDLPPVLVGITLQVPQSVPEYAWWCYLGEIPLFENEMETVCGCVGEQALVVDCPDCGGGDLRCLYCDGTGTVIE